MLRGRLKGNPKMITNAPSKPILGKPSPRLAQMLQDLTPDQREEAVKIAAKLLVIRARKRAQNASARSAPPPPTSPSETPET